MPAMHAKTNGVVYTPEWIVKLILDHVGYCDNIYNKKIIDPACGDGAFLDIIAHRLIKDARQNKISDTQTKTLLEANLFGFDTDAEAVKQCIAKLNKSTNELGFYDIDWQIIKADSLHKKDMQHHVDSFDFVVGNPPYVRIQHLGEERRQSLQAQWNLCENGSTDIFIAFFELGFALLAEQGKLGYITPNTYLKTRAGKSLRQFIKSSGTLKTLIDFGYHQLFESATTYSLITILDKTHDGSQFALYKGDKNHNITLIDKINIDNLRDENWVLTSNADLKTLKTMENRGAPLNQISRIHVGITTLADDYYIFKDPLIEGDKAQIILKDGRHFIIEKSILKPIIKASVLKESNQSQNRYVIFPYRKVAGKHKIINESQLRQEFPLTYTYFLAIKPRLYMRDKGKPNAVTWYAFGRSQGLDTSFGAKILTSPMNKKPNFITWYLPEYSFYAGYCVKFDGDLQELTEQLNSQEMEFYISHVGRDYQNNYKSFAKSFIENFGVFTLSTSPRKKNRNYA